jgi:hypothetical protein
MFLWVHILIEIMIMIVDYLVVGTVRCEEFSGPGLRARDIHIILPGARGGGAVCGGLSRRCDAVAAAPDTHCRARLH